MTLNISLKRFPMGGAVMVWGCFSTFDVSELHFIEGNLTGIMYGEIIENCLLPYIRTVVKKPTSSVMFVEDNDKKHTSPEPTRMRRKYRIDRLTWPASSPDLNPIENLWSILKKHVAKRRPHNKEDLKIKLREEWLKLEENYDLDKYIASMPRRIKAVIEAKE